MDRGRLARSRRCRADFGGNLVRKLGPGAPQVIGDLQPQPDRGGAAKISGEPQRFPA